MTRPGGVTFLGVELPVVVMSLASRLSKRTPDVDCPLSQLRNSSMRGLHPVKGLDSDGTYQGRPLHLESAHPCAPPKQGLLLSIDDLGDQRSPAVLRLRFPRRLAQTIWRSWRQLPSTQHPAQRPRATTTDRKRPSCAWEAQIAEKGLHFPTNYDSVGAVEFEEDGIEAKTQTS